MRGVLLLVLAVGFTSCGEAPPAEYELADARAALESSGLPVESASEVGGASMIGAVEGYNWTIQGEEVEVYRFDTSIQSGREALKRLGSQGLNGQPVTTNGNLALIVFDHPQDSALRRVFTENLGQGK